MPIRFKSKSLLSMTVSALVLAGCNPVAFDDFEKEAQVIAIKPVGNGEAGELFGTIAATASGASFANENSRSSWIVISGGAGKEVSVYNVWESGDFSEFRRDYSLCDDPNECGVQTEPLGSGEPDDLTKLGTLSGVPARTGVAVAAMPRWRKKISNEATTTRECIAIGDDLGGKYKSKDMNGQDIFPKQTPGILVACANEPTRTDYFSTPTSAERFGAALAGGDDFTIAGAPGSGELFFVSTDDAALQVIHQIYPFEERRVPGQVGTKENKVGEFIGELGDMVAVAPTAEGFEVLARSNKNKKVVKLRVKRADMSTTLRGCLDIAEGSGILIRDIDGDGVNESVVTQTNGSIGIFGDFSNECGAADNETPLLTIACPNDAHVSECGGFGTSIAAGDLNQDGKLELVVGAPDAVVDGSFAAGAIFPFTLSFSGTPSSESFPALTLAETPSSAQLGASITLVATDLDDARPNAPTRDEIVAGAPGQSTAFAFLCSGIPGDSVLDSGMRCRNE